MTRNEIRLELEEQLLGECICDYITKSEQYDVMDDLENWLKSAKSGDIYYYHGYEYPLTIEYEIAVWQTEEQRDRGEPVYMTPTCSNTDLEAIKQECESYDIEANGCIEIYELPDNEGIIYHYENGIWTSETI